MKYLSFSNKIYIKQLCHYYYKHPYYTIYHCMNNNNDDDGDDDDVSSTTIINSDAVDSDAGLDMIVSWRYLSEPM